MGEPLRSIAGRFGISDTSVCRHKAHVSQSIAKTAERREERLGDNLLDEIRRMNRKAWELLSKAEDEGDYRGAVVALREARECVESQDKMLTRAAEAGGEITHVLMDGLPEPAGLILAKRQIRGVQ